MARKLEDIFNECYERVRSGESINSCLRNYPEHRAELEPLLKTAFDVGRKASYIHPRPEFKHWAQVRLEGLQRYQRQQTPAAKPIASIWWRQSWAVAVIAILIVLLTGGSVMAASTQSLPTQPLYPVKLATEQVRLALAVSPAEKAQIQTELVQTRATEVEAMANAGNTDQVEKAADRLANQVDEAVQAISESEGVIPETIIYTVPPVTVPPETTSEPETITEPETTTQDKTDKFEKSIDDSTSKAQTALKDALEKADPKAKSKLQKAYDQVSYKSYRWPHHKKHNESKDKSQPSSQSDNKTQDENKAVTTVDTSQSDNKTGNENTSNSSQDKPYQPRNHYHD